MNMELDMKVMERDLEDVSLFTTLVIKYEKNCYDLDLLIVVCHYVYAICFDIDR